MCNLVDGQGHNGKLEHGCQKRDVTYDAYTVDVVDLKDAVGGVDIGLSDDKVTLLMGRMREPCLSIHGVQGGLF